MPVLDSPGHHSSPFPFFVCTSALDRRQCAALDRLFDLDDAWQERNEAFYQCFIRESTADVSDDLLRDTVARMREITGLPLLERVLVTAQRMEPGQRIGVHSDRPLLGYEIARLVVQLNADWWPELGGALELYDDPERPAVSSLLSGYNQAFGFLLHPGSYHGVSAVTRERRSVVFNFWHPANTPDLDTEIRRLFEGVHFSELPSVLDSVASEAEATLPEDVTYRASLAAMALCRWGFDEDLVVAGYRHSAGLATSTEPAVLLASWVAYLDGSSFDLSRWSALRESFRGVSPDPRCARIWSLCLPEG